MPPFCLSEIKLGAYGAAERIEKTVHHIEEYLICCHKGSVNLLNDCAELTVLDVELVELEVLWVRIGKFASRIFELGIWYAADAFTGQIAETLLTLELAGLTFQVFQVEHVAVVHLAIDYSDLWVIRIRH